MDRFIGRMETRRRPRRWVAHPDMVGPVKPFLAGIFSGPSVRAETIGTDGERSRGLSSSLSRIFSFSGSPSPAGGAGPTATQRYDG
jgi:hypothetical protein